MTLRRRRRLKKRQKCAGPSKPSSNASCDTGATCHCYVEEARAADLPPPSENELGMLDNVAAERRPNSRLSCQLKASAALEGLVLTLPDRQE